MHFIGFPITLIFFIVTKSQGTESIQLALEKLAFICRLITPLVDNYFVTRLLFHGQFFHLVRNHLSKRNHPAVFLYLFHALSHFKIHPRRFDHLQINSIPNRALDHFPTVLDRTLCFNESISPIHVLYYYTILLHKANYRDKRGFRSLDRQNIQANL